MFGHVDRICGEHFDTRSPSMHSILSVGNPTLNAKNRVAVCAAPAYCLPFATMLGSLCQLVFVMEQEVTVLSSTLLEITALARTEEGWSVAPKTPQLYTLVRLSKRRASRRRLDKEEAQATVLARECL